MSAGFNRARGLDSVLGDASIGSPRVLVVEIGRASIYQRLGPGNHPIG